MYVKNGMTANPYTISPETSIADALALMRSKGIKRLPVVHDGALVGFITHSQLLEVSPSPATTLSKYEADYLLSKTKVETIMTKDVITVTPDTLLEEASLLLRDNDIGGLPVIEDGKVVGIITNMDIFDAFIEIMGFRDKGTRIALDFGEDQPGIASEVAGVISNRGVNISHLAKYRGELIVRVNTENVDGIIKDLEAKGYRIISADTK